MQSPSVSTEKVRRYAGRNLSSVMGRVLARDAYHALEEIVSNSYDSDATLVEIDFDIPAQRFVVRDNGHGMDEEGLRTYFQLGGSPKRDARETARGRRTIGHFGIAATLVRYLSSSYSLTTVRDGIELYVREDFVDDDSIPVAVERREVPGVASGTSIEFLSPRVVLGSDYLNPKELRRRLGWSLPQTHDFFVEVDGESIGSRHLRNAIEYRFQRDVPKVGAVSGSVYYGHKTQADKPGVWVYVNGRQVGDPLSYNLEEIDPSFGNRVFAVVHADGLEDSVKFDRTGFQETPPFRNFREFIHTYVRSIKSDIEARKVDEQIERDLLRVYTVAEEVRMQIGRTSSWPYPPPQLEFTAPLRSGPLATYVPESNSFLINQDHPAIAIGTEAKGMKKGYLEAFLTFACAHAYGKAINPDEAEAMDHVALEQLAEYGKQSTPLRRQPLRTMHPDRLFTITDISKHTLLSKDVASQLMNYSDRVEKIGYKIAFPEFMRVVKGVSGLVPISDIVDVYAKDAGLRIDQRNPLYRVDTIIADLGDALAPHLRGWPEQNPIFFVEESFVPAMRNLLGGLSQFYGVSGD